MTQQLPNDELDTALILEGELKRRVAEIVDRTVEKKVINMVGKIIQAELIKYKAETLMEVSINVGKMLQMVENEKRKPLWEATPEEFGLTKDELNSHAITPMKNAYNNLDKELPNAIREQTPSV